MSTVIPFDLDNQKRPEDLFVLVGFWECWGKHAVNIMVPIEQNNL
jgi:hypothetical protein